MLSWVPCKKLKYDTVVAIESTAATRRNEKRNMTTAFLDILIRFLEMNQTGRARITISVATSSVVIVFHRAAF